MEWAAVRWRELKDTVSKLSLTPQTVGLLDHSWNAVCGLKLLAFLICTHAWHKTSSNRLSSLIVIDDTYILWTGPAVGMWHWCSFWSSPCCTLPPKYHSNRTLAVLPCLTVHPPAVHLHCYIRHQILSFFSLLLVHVSEFCGTVAWTVYLCSLGRHHESVHSCARSSADSLSAWFHFQHIPHCQHICRTHPWDQEWATRLGGKKQNPGCR